MDFVGKRRWFFISSGVFILVGLLSLAIPPALHLGIDFTGGSTISVKFETPVSEEAVRNELIKLRHPEATIQSSGNTDYFIRTITLKEGNVLTGAPSERVQLETALGELGTILRTPEFSSVGGVIARDTVRNSIIIVFAAAIAILLFVTYAFRGVPSSFRFGVAAIIALIHDLLIVLGIFSILGKLVDLEVNAMFITGLLFVIGYSVNDTIVVFDRIRENVTRSPGQPIEISVNNSILESLGRSLTTSLTLLFTILTLLFLGGESIRNFLIVLLIAVISGTYSSICIASQVLVSWEKGEAGRILSILPFFSSRSKV